MIEVGSVTHCHLFFHCKIYNQASDAGKDAARANSLEVYNYQQPDAPVEQVMAPAAIVLEPKAIEHEAAGLFDRRELISVAVVHEAALLLQASAL